jgi:hypothetical protein
MSVDEINLSYCSFTPYSSSSQPPSSSRLNRNMTPHITSCFSPPSRRLFLLLALSIAALNVLSTGLAVAPRRRFFSLATPLLLRPASAAAAAVTESDLLQELARAKGSLKDLPALVGEMQWDPVRVELRRPVINALWNVNDSQNSLRKLASMRGDPDILEAAEDVARNLRDVDQIVYSNSFSMEGKMAGAGLRTDGGAVGRAGEGGGKYRVKEPQDLLKAAVLSIDGVLATAARE